MSLNNPKKNNKINTMNNSIHARLYNQLLYKFVGKTHIYKITIEDLLSGVLS
jgi:hypothetical protein